jgi:hypothetical protein
MDPIAFGAYPRALWPNCQGRPLALSMRRRSTETSTNRIEHVTNRERFRHFLHPVVPKDRRIGAGTSSLCLFEYKCERIDRGIVVRHYQSIFPSAQNDFS